MKFLNKLCFIVRMIEINECVRVFENQSVIDLGFIFAGIIYDTHGANIKIKICTAKFLSKFLKWEWIIGRRYFISPGELES